MSVDGDWNVRFQRLLGLPEDSAAAVLSKYREINRLAVDFVQTAQTYAQVIVNEQFSRPEAAGSGPASQSQAAVVTTVPLARLGGVAGGHKYLVRGLLFKLSVDPLQESGCYLYGGAAPRYDLACKAAAHDQRGANLYLQASLQLRRSGALDEQSALRVPFQVMIDYRGFRLIAMPQLRGDKTLHYGSSDQCKSIACDPQWHNSLRLSAELLHLAEHPVGRQECTARLYTAGDVEGVKFSGDDGRYLLDLARTLPPEPPSVVSTLPPVKGAAYLRLMRGELLARWKELGEPPLSSDAWTGFSTKSQHPFEREAETEETAELEDRAVDATMHLLDDVIPELARDLQSGVEQATLHGLERLSNVLHSRGINVRHSGLLLSLVDLAAVEARQALAVQMIARSFKQRLRYLQRECAETAQTAAVAASARFVEMSEFLQRQTVVSFLNHLTGSDRSEADQWWQAAVDQLVSQFGHVAFKELHCDSLSTYCQPLLEHIVRHLLAMSHVELTEECRRDWAGSGYVDFAFTVADIVETSRCRVKWMSLVQYSSAKAQSAEAALLRAGLPEDSLNLTPAQVQAPLRLLGLAVRSYEAVLLTDPMSFQTQLDLLVSRAEAADIQARFSHCDELVAAFVRALLLNTRKASGARTRPSLHIVVERMRAVHSLISLLTSMWKRRSCYTARRGASSLRLVFMCVKSLEAASKLLRDTPRSSTSGDADAVVRDLAALKSDVAGLLQTEQRVRSARFLCSCFAGDEYATEARLLAAQALLTSADWFAVAEGSDEWTDGGAFQSTLRRHLLAAMTVSDVRPANWLEHYLFPYVLYCKLGGDMGNWGPQPFAFSETAELVDLAAPYTGQGNPWLEAGDTLLHAVVKSGGPKMLDRLLDERPAADPRDQKSCTPLYYAIAISSLPLVQRLVDYGASQQGIDSTGLLSALEVAMNKAEYPVVRFLLGRVAKLGVEQMRRLELLNDLHMLRLVLVHGRHALTQTLVNAALQVAATQQRADVVNTLLLHAQPRAQLEAVNEQRDAPLTLCIANVTHANVLATLLRHKQQLDRISPSTRQSVLHSLCEQRFDSALDLELLLQAARRAMRQAEFDDFLNGVGGADQLTPAMACVSAAPTLGRLALLRRAGADINRANFKGLTPLIRACEKGHSAQVVFLMRHCGADPLQADSAGRSALMAAAEEKREGAACIAALKRLTSVSGAAVPWSALLAQKNKWGRTAAELAASGDCKDNEAVLSSAASPADTAADKDYPALTNVRFKQLHVGTPMWVCDSAECMSSNGGEPVLNSMLFASCRRCPRPSAPHAAWTADHPHILQSMLLDGGVAGECGCLDGCQHLSEPAQNVALPRCRYVCGSCMFEMCSGCALARPRSAEQHAADDAALEPAHADRAVLWMPSQVKLSHARLAETAEEEVEVLQQLEPNGYMLIGLQPLQPDESGSLRYFEVTVLREAAGSFGSSVPASCIGVGLAAHGPHQLRQLTVGRQSVELKGNTGRVYGTNDQLLGNANAAPYCARFSTSIGAHHTVGAGWDESIRQLFFTLDGQHLGAVWQAHANNELQPWHATVRLSALGCKVRVNFGNTTPFRFDVAAYRNAQRETAAAVQASQPAPLNLPAAGTDTRSDSLPPPPPAPLPTPDAHVAPMAAQASSASSVSFHTAASLALTASSEAEAAADGRQPPGSPQNAVVQPADSTNDALDGVVSAASLPSAVSAEAAAEFATSAAASPRGLLSVLSSCLNTAGRLNPTDPSVDLVRVEAGMWPQISPTFLFADRQEGLVFASANQLTEAWLQLDLQLDLRVQLHSVACFNLPHVPVLRKAVLEGRAAPSEEWTCLTSFPDFSGRLDEWLVCTIPAPQCELWLTQLRLRKTEADGQLGGTLAVSAIELHGKLVAPQAATEQCALLASERAQREARERGSEHLELELELVESDAFEQCLRLTRHNTVVEVVQAAAPLTLTGCSPIAVFKSKQLFDHGIVQADILVTAPEVPPEPEPSAAAAPSIAVSLEIGVIPSHVAIDSGAWLRLPDGRVVPATLGTVGWSLDDDGAVADHCGPALRRWSVARFAGRSCALSVRLDVDRGLLQFAVDREWKGSLLHTRFLQLPLAFAVKLAMEPGRVGYCVATAGWRRHQDSFDHPAMLPSVDAVSRARQLLTASLASQVCLQPAWLALQTAGRAVTAEGVAGVCLDCFVPEDELNVQATFPERGIAATWPARAACVSCIRRCHSGHNIAWLGDDHSVSGCACSASGLCLCAAAPHSTPPAGGTQPSGTLRLCPADYCVPAGCSWDAAQSTFNAILLEADTVYLSAHGAVLPVSLLSPALREGKVSVSFRVLDFPYDAGAGQASRGGGLLLGVVPARHTVRPPTLQLNGALAGLAAARGEFWWPRPLSTGDVLTIEADFTAKQVRMFTNGQRLMPLGWKMSGEPMRACVYSPLAGVRVQVLDGAELPLPVSAPAQQCPRGHPLLHSDARPPGGAGLCVLCGKSMERGGFYCTACPVTLCRPCAHKPRAEQSMLRARRSESAMPLECRAKHFLSPVQYHSEDWRCEMQPCLRCSAPHLWPAGINRVNQLMYPSEVNSTVLGCSLCDPPEYICAPCSRPAELFILPADPSWSIKCLHGHSMRLVSPDGRPPNYSSGDYLCDLCRARAMQLTPFFHCDTCGNFDLCTNCCARVSAEPDWTRRSSCSSGEEKQLSSSAAYFELTLSSLPASSPTGSPGGTDGIKFALGLAGTDHTPRWLLCWDGVTTLTARLDGAQLGYAAANVQQGSVLGCGFDSAAREIFFTLDGRRLALQSLPPSTERPQPVSLQVAEAAAVSWSDAVFFLHEPGQEAHVNFGAQPFRLDELNDVRQVLSPLMNELDAERHSPSVRLMEQNRTAYRVDVTAIAWPGCPADACFSLRPLVPDVIEHFAAVAQPASVHSASAAASVEPAPSNQAERGVATVCDGQQLCDKGHTMELYSNHLVVTADGSQIATFTCLTCGAAEQPTDYYYHCAPCGSFLCKLCCKKQALGPQRLFTDWFKRPPPWTAGLVVQCQAGHVCTFYSSVPPGYSLHLDTWLCDRCKRVDQLLLEGLCHCDTCTDYDVCFLCVCQMAVRGSTACNSLVYRASAVLGQQTSPTAPCTLEKPQSLLNAISLDQDRQFHNETVPAGLPASHTAAICAAAYPLSAPYRGLISTDTAMAAPVLYFECVYGAGCVSLGALFRSTPLHANSHRRPAPPPFWTAASYFWRLDTGLAYHGSEAVRVGPLCVEGDTVGCGIWDSTAAGGWSTASSTAAWVENERQTEPHRFTVFFTCNGRLLDRRFEQVTLATTGRYHYVYPAVGFHGPSLGRLLSVSLAPSVATRFDPHSLPALQEAVARRELLRGQAQLAQHDESPELVTNTKVHPHPLRRASVEGNDVSGPRCRICLRHFEVQYICQQCSEGRYCLLCALPPPQGVRLLSAKAGQVVPNGLFYSFDAAEALQLLIRRQNAAHLDTPVGLHLSSELNLYELLELERRFDDSKAGLVYVWSPVHDELWQLWLEWQTGGGGGGKMKWLAKVNLRMCTRVPEILRRRRVSQHNPDLRGIAAGSVAMYVERPFTMGEAPAGSVLDSDNEPAGPPRPVPAFNHGLNVKPHGGTPQEQLLVREQARQKLHWLQHDVPVTMVISVAGAG